MKTKTTYWTNNGAHQAVADKLQKLIPAQGECPKSAPKLELFRQAVNCYYDYYNNALCNRLEEFENVFGFTPNGITDDCDDEGEAERIIRETFFGPENISLLEQKMNNILLEAATEQKVYFNSNRPCYRITYSDGDIVETEMNCGLEEATAYFKSFARITEDSKGKESSADAIAICDITEEKKLILPAKAITHGEEVKGELLIITREDNKDNPFYLFIHKVSGSYFVTEFITGYKCGSAESNKADAIFSALMRLRSMNWVSVMQAVNSKERINTLPANLSAAKVIHLFSVRSTK